MIAAAVEVLRQGREVRVVEVAESAGVSHSLIYRHFPQGGREELIAEAYARIFRAAVMSDIEAVTQLEPDTKNLRPRLHGIYRQILSGARAKSRWARLEALAQSRRNAHAARRMDQTRAELLDGVAAALQRTAGWDISAERTRAYALIALSVPLGFTAMVEPAADEAIRDQVADVWAAMTVAWLRSEGLASDGEPAGD